MSVPRSTLTALSLLTVNTGVVDAVTVLGFDVFAANMTGNVVFLGFSLAGAPDYTLAPILVALASFLVGGWIAGRVLSTAARNAAARVLGLEAALFVIAAGLALGLGSAGGQTDLHETGPWSVLVLTAMAMGAQNVVALKRGIDSMKTTVLTLTLTSLAAGGSDASTRNQQVQSVLLLALGGLVGALLVVRLGLAPALLLCGVLSAAAVWPARALDARPGSAAGR